MTFRLLLLIMTSVSLSALAQVALKAGMSGQRIQLALEGSAGAPNLALTVIGAPLVWIGLSMYLLGALVWLLVLARIDVSLAYPFVGLGFILVMLFGFFLLGEAIGPVRIVGTFLVVAGVVLISAN